MNLAAQRAVELSHQKEALLREFENWRERSKEGQQLEKHHTQTRRITARLEGILENVQIKDPAGEFDANEEAFRMLLAAQRIWDFFRSKLSLRDEPWLRDDLMCADEFAWECYQPPRDCAAQAGTITKESVKEPPMVFFNTDASPFAQARDTPFAPQGIMERDVLNLGDAVLNLPIPIIGVPWSQLRHIPSAVVIGHEVGHAVEHDMKLEAVVESLIRNLAIPDSRKEAWLAWRHEVFADVYGVLCSGPAAVVALSAYLVTDQATIQQETVTAPNWGTYPTRYLRMKLNFELLRQRKLLEPSREIFAKLGLAEGDLEKAWKETYEFHQMSHFEKDLEQIVSMLFKGPYPSLGGVSLPEVIAFGEKDLDVARKRAERVIFDTELPAEGDKMRRLFAAAALAYYSAPQKYAQKDHTRELGGRFRKAISAGVRSGAGSRTENEIAALEAADRQAGSDFLGLYMNKEGDA